VGTKEKRIAAHFLLHHELAESPPNTAILHAYDELGVDVHIYTPGADRITDTPFGCTEIFPVSYDYSWILRNLLHWKWSGYTSISGTTEDPMAIVGLISRFHRVPSFTLSDEIKSGSYSGNRNSRWKNLCRNGMAGGRFTIVNDKARIALQREYCGASDDHEIMVYPGCFHNTPPAGDRTRLRAERNIPEDALVLCFSGVSNPGNGGDWLPEILEQNPHLHLWGQFVNLDSDTRNQYENISRPGRVHIEKTRLQWRECWSSMATADIGVVIYTQTGPQFQHMGISSNRLCMFLAMGVPVIARRQESFQFIEDYECGVLVDSIDEAAHAVSKIANRLGQYRLNALRCCADYINAADAYQALRDNIYHLVH
jgi:glycosyltransferase involved in cell wall biosynthesis